MTDKDVEDLIEVWEKDVLPWMEDKSRHLAAHAERSTNKDRIVEFCNEVSDRFKEYIEGPYGKEVVEWLIDVVASRDRIESKLEEAYYSEYLLWIEHYQDSQNEEFDKRWFMGRMVDKYQLQYKHHKLMRLGLKELIRRIG